MSSSSAATVIYAWPLHYTVTLPCAEGFLKAAVVARNTTLIFLPVQVIFKSPFLKATLPHYKIHGHSVKVSFISHLT